MAQPNSHNYNNNNYYTHYNNNPNININNNNQYINKNGKIPAINQSPNVNVNVNVNANANANNANASFTKKQQKVSSNYNKNGKQFEKKEVSAFDKLMIEYPTYKHCFINLGLMSANGMSFKHEVKDNKSQEDIAKEKAIMQLQVQCSIKGGEAILGLQFEFTKNDIGICICTAYGTAVKYKR